MYSEQLTQLASLSTSSISDALDLMGINGGCLGIRSINPGHHCIGPAFTVRFEPVDDGHAPAADYIDTVPPNAVIVLDNGGLQNCTVWGDILTSRALHQKIAGTVINGCCRDSENIRALGYPIFAVSTYMKSGKNRVRMVEKNVPVAFGNTIIHPGDLVFGDDDGVLAIPQKHVVEITKRAIEVVSMEQKLLEELSNGMSLVEARKAVGYNQYALKKNQDKA